MSRPTGTTTAGTRASGLAARIEDLVANLPKGAFIGTEADLLERFQVGRGTLRQAVRCLERRGVAQMRRGPGGGLVVTTDGAERLATGLSVALEMLGPSLDDLSATGSLFRRDAVGLAALRSDESQSRRLMALADSASQADTLSVYADRRSAFLRALAMASGDPILAAVIDATSRAIRHGMPIFDMLYRDFDRDVKHLKEADCAVAAAVAARDPHGAQSAADISVGIEFASFRRAMVANRFPDPAAVAWRANALAANARTAQRIAWTLRLELRALPVGTPLGTEQMLATQFGIGRAVMREALRMLADFGLVRHRRGGTGGVLAGAFDPWITTAGLTATLRQISGDLWRARALVEAEAARRAALQRAGPSSKGETLTRYLVARSDGTALATLLALFASATEVITRPAASPYDDRLLTAVLERDAFFARRFAIERCHYLSGV